MEFLKEIERNHLDVYGIEIMQNGNLIFKKSFTPDIRYPIYSATKSLTSTAIGIASDEGKISIYEPLSNYLEKNYLKNMYLSVHELSLLGQLYLQKGVFNNNRIISEKWVNEATKIKIDNGNEKYGYFFWVNNNHFSISGKWGQKCLIYPNKNIVATYLGNMKNDSNQMQKIMENFIENYL